MIDKFISSRNIIQIRSHAQKFFKRLKEIKNNEYDFSSDEIKNLNYILANKRDINMDTYENDEINKDNTYSKEIDLNNIIEREQNKEAQEQDNYLDDDCIYNMSNNKFNDDNIFLLGDSDCFFSDEISSKVINNISYKIIKSHYLNLISKYFC